MSRVPGADLARLVLRVGLGGTMVAHGVRHGRSLAGTAGWFGSLGFRRPGLQAAASAAVEVVSGAALVAGAATPLAGAAVTGTLGVAAGSVHRRNGFFIDAEGYEYVLNLALATSALSALGPGRWSVDRRLGLDRIAPGTAVLTTAGLGLAGAAAHLALFWRPPRPTAVQQSGTDSKEQA